MSLKMMVRVMEEIEVTRPQQSILLAMAENAADDGSRCFPSVDLIAWKAGYKRRQVVTIMRELRDANIIEEVAPARGTRPAEYHLQLENAPQKPSFNEWRAQNQRPKSEPVGVQSDVSRGAISGHDEQDEGCNLASGGVQSDVTGVQSQVARGAIHCTQNRRTVIEPSGTEIPADTREEIESPEQGIPRSQVDPGGFEKRFGTPNPFLLVATMCNELGVAADDLPKSDRGRQMAIAKRLQTEGMTDQDVRRITRWLKAQDWVTSVDMNLIEKQRSKWILAGKPDRNEPTRKQPPQNLQTNKERHDKSVWLGGWKELAGYDEAGNPIYAEDKPA